MALVKFVVGVVLGVCVTGMVVYAYYKTMANLKLLMGVCVPSCLLFKKLWNSTNKRKGDQVFVFRILAVLTWLLLLASPLALSYFVNKLGDLMNDDYRAYKRVQEALRKSNPQLMNKPNKTRRLQSESCY